MREETADKWLEAAGTEIVVREMTRNVAKSEIGKSEKERRSNLRSINRRILTMKRFNGSKITFRKRRNPENTLRSWMRNGRSCSMTAGTRGDRT